MIEMTDSRAAEVLAAHNEWRRYDGLPGEPGAPEMGDPVELGRAIDHVVSRLRSKPPAEEQPSAPVGVEGFEQWYARVDARFWNNWDACNAAFHAGKRAAIAQQPAAANKPAGYPVGNQPREARSE